MMQQYTDKNLTCVDCGATFLFSADDQEFYARKGFTNEPKRCKACRDKRKPPRAKVASAPSTT